MADDTEPHTLIINPYVDAYGYVSSFFDFNFPYGMFGVNAYI